MTYAEIAKVLNCSDENVRKIERKALRKLARRGNSSVILYLHYLEIIHEPIDRRSIWQELEEMI